MEISSTIVSSGSLLKAPVIPDSVTQTEGQRRASTADTLNLSPAARSLINSNTDSTPSITGDASTAERSENESGAEESAESESPSEESAEAKNASSGSAEALSAEALSESDKQNIERLKRRDAEVKAHEQAHMSAAGDLAQGSASFDYERGPDGKRYAVGGEVSIDTSSVPGDPQATLIKAQKIRRAASAPVDPSSQDRSVAAEASRMETQARAEVSQQSREKLQQYADDNTPQIDFLGAQNDQNEKAIQDTYSKIQNASVLQEKSFIDFFI